MLCYLDELSLCWSFPFVGSKIDQSIKTQNFISIFLSFLAAFLKIAESIIFIILFLLS